MSWKPEADEIERRRELAAQHGGPEAVEKQHARGRLTVRERIDALVDKGSFREHAPIAGVTETDASGKVVSFTPTNVVAGTALIDGRRIVVCGDDFTIRGAAYSAVGLKKGLYADALAVRRRPGSRRPKEARVSGRVVHRTYEGPGGRRATGQDYPTQPCRRAARRSPFRG